jgi:hypothetical protein
MNSKNPSINVQIILHCGVYNKMMNFRITGMYVSVMLMLGCENPDREHLVLGTWQVDSIYTFYNGFDFTSYEVDEEPVLEFKAEGISIFSLGAEQRSFRYAIHLPDTLKLMTADSSRVLHEYKINQLTPHSMILRQEKRTLFKEKNQDRYEIRYLSRAAD